MASAAVHETHIGMVLLIGDRAYKLKKPIRTPYLDFSSTALRTAVCHREVELNRRLAPDVYLGVGHLSGPAGDPNPEEPVVVMRRMPEDRRLSTMVAAGTITPAELRRLARLMAAFHSGADRGPAVTRDGSAAALRARWRANVDELGPYAGTVLDDALVHAIDVTAMRFVDGRGALFADRLARDRVVDGHGDLIADDVFCLDDGPRVLDCLEFDDRLRHVDVLDDVAFLAMDLERLGHPDLGALFIQDYLDYTADPAPAALVHHFIAYRAVVRAKVSCLRHAQGDRSAAAAAVAYASTGLRHLELAAVRLALVGGLPGTGKTTLGGALADRFGATMLSSDRVRKELAGIDPHQHASAPYRQGLYSEEHTARTYAELLRRAGALLARGESVVLDASWASAAHRATAMQLAGDTHSDLLQLRCSTAKATASRRIATRVGGASDATPDIAAAMATDAQRWPAAVTVPTSGSVEESLEVAAAAWRAAAAGSV